MISSDKISGSNYMHLVLTTYVKEYVSETDSNLEGERNNIVEADGCLSLLLKWKDISYKECMSKMFMIITSSIYSCLELVMSRL